MHSKKLYLKVIKSSVSEGNLASFYFGTAFGWATINFVELTSEHTTFPTGKLDLKDAALVVSIVEIGGLIGDFAMLPICDRFGIKKSIHFLGIPMVVSSSTDCTAII